MRWRNRLLADLRTKAVAVFIALIVFAITRDQVVRTFPVRLEVREDSSRILLSELPRHVDIEVRGAWGRINQISPADFGVYELDLRSLSAGPLHLEASAIALPNGVSLARAELDHEPVSLVFVPALVRKLAIEADLQGAVDRGSEITSVRVLPAQWAVRGPRRAVERLSSLATLPVEVGGLNRSFEVEIELAPPPAEASYVDEAPGRHPRVTVAVQIRDRQSEREVSLEVVELLKTILPQADLLTIGKVSVKLYGPLRQVDALLAEAKPLVAEVESLARDTASGGFRVGLVFKWRADLPESMHAGVRFEPATLEVSVAAASPTEPPALPMRR